MPPRRPAARARHPIVPAEWGMREMAAAAAALVAPWRSARRESRLAAALAERLDGATVLPMCSGRAALRLALEAFRGRRPERDLVLVPAYVCPSVIDAVVAAGCRPAPVAVGDDLNLTTEALESAAKADDVLAIVAVHMYGAPADIVAIEDLGRRAGAFVVDDAAQVLGVHVDGRPLGTFGDAGILSFAQSKTLVTGVRGSGGALIAKDPELVAELRETIGALPRAPHRWRHFTRFCLAHFFGRIGRSLAWRMPEHRPGDFEPARIAGLDAALALAQLASADRRVAGRIRCAGEFARQLRVAGDIPMPQRASGRYLTRVLVGLPASVDREALRRRLRDAGVETRLPYDLRPVERHGTASPAGARLLELPSHSRMTADSVESIVRELQAALAEHAHEPAPARAEG